MPQRVDIYYPRYDYLPPYAFNDDHPCHAVYAVFPTVPTPLLPDVYDFVTPHRCTTLPDRFQHTYLPCGCTPRCGSTGYVWLLRGLRYTHDAPHSGPAHTFDHLVLQVPWTAFLVGSVPAFTTPLPSIHCSYHAPYCLTVCSWFYTTTRLPTVVTFPSSCLYSC